MRTEQIDSRAKYEPPRLEKLGSVAELALSGTGSIKDTQGGRSRPSGVTRGNGK